MPVVAQTDANKAKEPQKPLWARRRQIIEQWNDVGRKLIAMAEDFPEDKYEIQTKSGFADVCRESDTRFRVDVLLHGFGAGKTTPVSR